MDALGIGTKGKRYGVLSGITEAEAKELDRLALVGYTRGEITSSELKSLRKSFNNPRFRLQVNKQAYIAAYESMVKGDMTMAEFMGFMPPVYRESESLKRVLLEYEAQLNTMYPNRKAAWDIAAAKYAEKNQQFRRVYDQLLTKFGIPIEKQEKQWWQSGNADNSATYAPKVQGSKEAAAAVATKVSAGIDQAATNVMSDVRDYQIMHPLYMLKSDMTWTLPLDKFIWQRNLGTGSRGGIDINKLLTSMATLKTKKTVIAKVKEFAIKNNWKIVQDADIIEDFMLHVLKHVK